MGEFEKIFRGLNKEKVKYLIVGGVAVNLYGYLRFTGDLDILLLLEEKNLEKIDKAMKRLGYAERLPVSVKSLSNHEQVRKWLKDKNMKAFSFFYAKGPGLMIDLLIEESLKFDKVYKHSVKKYFDNVLVPVISIDYLIKMKRKAGRDKDLIDLEALIELKKNEENNS